MAFDEVINGLRRKRQSRLVESNLPVAAVRTVGMDWTRCPRGSYSRSFAFENPSQEIPAFLQATSACLIDAGNPPFVMACDGAEVSIRIGDPQWGPTGLEHECAQTVGHVYDDMRHTYSIATEEDPYGY